MILFRPVDLEELRLVYEANLRAFPPRLPDQPIFYPVTNEGYARQIAKDWNTRSGTLAGFVKRFEVGDTYIAKFERRIGGAREHEELWVPAEELSEFNTHIVGQIAVVGAYFGVGYRGSIADALELKGKDAVEQLVWLARNVSHDDFDLAGEIASNHTALFLNFYFWQQHDFAERGIGGAERKRVLATVAHDWASRSRSPMPLGIVCSTA